MKAEIIPRDYGEYTVRLQNRREEQFHHCRNIEDAKVLISAASVVDGKIKVPPLLRQ